MSNNFEKFGGWLLVLELFYVWKVIEYGGAIIGAITTTKLGSPAIQLPIWYFVLFILALVCVGMVLMNTRKRMADVPNKIVRYNSFILGINCLVSVVQHGVSLFSYMSLMMFLLNLPTMFILLTYLVIIPYLKFSQRVKTYYGLNAEKWY